MNVNLSLVAERIWAHKYSFFALFFAFFLVTYLFFVAIDFVPEPKTEKTDTTNGSEVPAFIDTAGDENTAPVVSNEVVYEYPTSIYIEKLDRKIPVLNPESRDIADLDAALLNGVVRHPDSAKLAQNGNIFILGHSSYLPSVVNKNFQAFNGIQDLAWGDIIEVSSGNRVYVFEVDKVFKAQASELVVPIAVDGRRLTLATCNSFGSIDDRFIVEAKQIEVRTL